MQQEPLEKELEEQIDALGFELVELERAGSRARPILRLRVDRADGSGVTLDDCASISRALEAKLDGSDRIAERYTLEVSSPGVDRPLVRDRDFERFAGQQIAVQGDDLLDGRARRLEGELLGLGETGTGAVVRLRLPDGAEIDIPRSEITRAHLIFRWQNRA